MVQQISDMVKIAGQTVDRATLTGLQSASQKSGVSFQYLVAKAAQESSLQPDAQADTSSAAGLFQFTRGTWLDMMKKYGSLYGYGGLAQKISTGDDGKPVVKDAAADKQLMALRGNPEASALMAAEYARDNATSLQDTLGHSPDASDLYLAHFLGASGASQLLSASTNEPTASAVSILPAAAKANTSVFYNAAGHARTAAEVVKLVRDRFTGQMDRYADAASAVGMTDASTPIAPERGTVSPDMRAAIAKTQKTDQTDPTKAMVTQFMIEEMAKQISAHPMSMSDGGEEEDADGNSSGSDGGLSSGAFKGNDLTTAMTRALTKSSGPHTPNQAADQAALERGIAKGRAAEANRTYEMLNAVPSVPFVPVPNDDQS